MKKLCRKCNRITKHTKKKVGSERERDPFFSIGNIMLLIISLGLGLFFWILGNKTKYYDITCKECNTGRKWVPE